MSEADGKQDADSAKKMDEIAKGLFAPIYPVIAEQIAAHTGCTKGRCIDAGCGPASLSIALAKMTDLNMLALDSSRDMLEAAGKNITDEGLTERFVCVYGDVHDIPLGNGTVDLIISRGSMFFWDDLEQAFAEIYRVLAPGGMTYIGGGFGNAELRDFICREMVKENPEWEDFRNKNLGKSNKERFREAIEKLGPDSYDFITDDSGFWIVISKEEL